MDTVAETSWIPVVDCGAEFGDYDLFEKEVVDESGEEWRPYFEDGDDGLRIVGSPRVVDGRANLWEDEVVEKRFVGGRSVD